MFGRKDRKAIATLPPLHQALVNEGQLVATLHPEQWHELLVSLRHHDELVHKHHLPPRTLDFLVPLVRVLAEDVPATGYLSVRADLRGPEGKAIGAPIQVPPPGPRVKKIIQTTMWDPWLSVEARLNNKAKADLQIADSVRERTVTAHRASGKVKTKAKRKTVQRVRVRLALPAALPVTAPASGIPSWCHITMSRDTDRIHLDGRMKYGIVVPEHKHSVFSVTPPQSPGAPTDAQLKNVLLLMGEIFRWIPKSRPSKRRHKLVLLESSVKITEDEADLLISMRREKEKRIPFREVVRKHVHDLAD